MIDDYSAVAAPDDEEELRRRQAEEEGKYAPVSSSAALPQPTNAPASGEALPAAPGMVGGGASKASLDSALAVPSPSVKLAPQRPQWKDYAPAESHGWGKFGHIMAGLSPLTNRFFNVMPEQRAEQKYKNAASEYDAGEKEQLTDAQIDQAKANTKKIQTETERVGQPKPKEESWEVTPHFTGPNGEPVEVEKNSGQMRMGGKEIPGIKGIAPKPEKPDNPEQQFIDEYQQKHKGATIAEAQRAFKQNEHIVDPANKTDKDNARSDRSYQFHSTRIDKLRAPIEQKMERISRLEDTLDQGTPQADALVAPELLSVMAGGQGSGLRMNEAEIARIVGGRDKWQDLKAKLDAYRLDPNKGFAITPEQRQQVRALFDAVKERTSKKMAAIDEESANLINTDDAHEHRKIYNRLQQRLNEADSERKEAEPTRPESVPREYVYHENGPKGKGWYKPQPKKP